jgi:PHD/YefM family antitoxin component YafN of YafNO toxin-antitoxin module
MESEDEMAKRKSVCCPSEDEWEAERDLEAVTRAKAVEKDPGRMEKVRKLARKRLEESKQRRDQAQAMVDIGEGKNP